MEWIPFLSKIKRTIRAVAEGHLTVIIVASVAAIGIILHSGINAGSLITWLIAGIVISLGLMVFQTHLRYMKDKFDPTLALRYEKIFDEEMKSDRNLAAQVLKEQKHHLSEIGTDEQKKKLEPIDPVLDLLDSLGFYMKAEQISDAVLHQHFYYWIRGYWLSSRPYIEAWQAKPHEGPRWEHIETLFEATCRIECARGKTTKERERGIDTDKFLDEEIDEPSIPATKTGH
jgi:hypothetical protein